MKVLVVDDEPLIRRGLRRALELRGHEVHTSEDGVAGLEAWRLLDPDIVIVDVLMPGYTGPQLIDLMAPQSKAKVVLMTAHGAGWKSEVAPDLFLEKPFEDIFKVVESIEALAK